MTRFGKTLIKQMFFKEIDSLLKKYDFQRGQRGGVVSIERETNATIQYVSIFTYSLDEISFSFARITHKKVNEILKNIFLNPDETSVVLDGSLVHDCFDVQYSTTVKSERDIEIIGKKFENSLINHFLPAFEKYSDPKNVLEFWDSLDEEGKTNHFFDPYNYTKLLILSKLINEDKYEKRKIETLELYEKLQATGKHYHLDKLENLEKVIRYIEKK